MFFPEKLKNIEKISDILMMILFSSFIIFSIDTSGIYIMVALSIIIYIINCYVSNTLKKIHFGIFHIYLLIFAIFSFFSSLWSIEPEYAYEKGITLLEFLVFFSILYAAYYNIPIARLFNIVMWAGFLISFYTIFFVGIENLSEIIEEGSRLENEFANVNVIGMTCCESILIALYFYKIRRNFLLILLCLPALIIVASSNSRKAFLMLIFGILLILLFQRHEKKSRSHFIKLGFSLVLFAVIIFLIFDSQLFEGSVSRLDGLIASFNGEGEIDSSTALREQYTQIGFNQLNQTPFLGLGMGNGRILAYEVSGFDAYLHNNYAELAADGGIIGLILYYWIYIPIIGKEVKYRKSDKWAVLILILVGLMLIMDYGAVSYYSKTTYFMLMIYILHLNKIHKNKELNTEIGPSIIEAEK